MWKVVIGEAEQGLIVSLEDTSAERPYLTTVGRVGYRRLGTANPLRSFPSQLQRVLARAHAEADSLNGEGMRTSGRPRS
jgi:hypothetical protein